MLSIVTPAFNEAPNLEALYARLVRFFERTGGDWEWIVVDDHSRDDTFGVIERLSLAGRPGPRLSAGAQFGLARGHHLRIASRAG